tara:strand:+ start:251 stop:619 length:369 start_codon:yes stop_codon:yes gene_type:complete
MTDIKQIDKQPSERESFDNFLDYKTGLEQKYSVSLNTKNRKDIYIAVINELRERNLVNKSFYENELETYSFLEDDTDALQDFMHLCLNIYIIIFLCGILGIIVMGKFKNLAKDSFNTTLHEL